MDRDKPSPTVVIGLGNPLMGDDGLGVTVISRLREHWEFPEEVELVDGGTRGVGLLPIIEGADRLILIDAIDVGGEPGAEVVLARSELPRLLATKISVHQIDLRELLALAEMRGTLPEQTIALGLQPEPLDVCTELSPQLRGRLERLIARVIRQLEAWGIRVAPRGGREEEAGPEKGV